MTKEPAAQGAASAPARGDGRGWTRRWTGGWTLGVGDPETVLAGARRALFVMTGVLAVIWAIQIANVADGYHLSQSYGIMPRDVGALPYILTAPFLHASWTHIEGNSGPLFIFGFLAAYRGLGKFALLTVIVAVTSGLAAWLFEPSRTVGVGASGVVFGYFGYIIVRGLFDRHVIDVLIGAVMALCFAYQFAVLLPHVGIGWQAHVGGLVGGVLCGWLLRDRRAVQRAGRPVAVKQASTATAVTKPSTTSKDLVIDPSNPRAELYKQLDDMGL